MEGVIERQSPDTANIPLGWKWVKLGDVLKVSSGKGLKVNHLKGGDYPVYGGNGINGYHSSYLIDNPKLIIGRVGVKCGVTHITKSKSWVTDNALIVEPSIQDFDLKFFKLKLGFENLNKLSVSTAQPVISGSKIYAYKILLPPLTTQRAIVSKIEELFRELDKGKQQLEIALQQLKVYRQAVLKWAFEGKFTNKDVKEGELPEGWRWLRPEDIASHEKYSIGIGPFGSNLKVSDYKLSGVPLIFVKNITRRDFSLSPKFISKDKLKELYPHSVQPLDILITKMGDPPGDCAIYPESYPEAVITSDCLKLRVDEKLVNRKYIYYALQTQLIKRQFELITKGVAQKKISLQRFKSIKIPAPCSKEQLLIVDILERKLTICDKVEETINQSLAQAETLRQSILKKAFEGKLL